MKLKIPPAFVLVFCIGLMWLLDQFVNGGIKFSGSRYVAYVMFGLGVLWGVLGLLEFYRASTTIDPHNVQKVNTLVDGGIYQLSRNPMYVGLLFVLVSAAFYMENLLTLFVVPFFVVYMNRYQIIPEEEVLLEKFGDEYQRYKSKVNRWL